MSISTILLGRYALLPKWLIKNFPKVYEFSQNCLRYSKMSWSNVDFNHYFGQGMLFHLTFYLKFSQSVGIIRAHLHVKFLIFQLRTFWDIARYVGFMSILTILLGKVCSSTKVIDLKCTKSVWIQQRTFMWYFKEFYWEIFEI